MSAYQVSDEQLRLMAICYVSASLERVDFAMATRVAKVLWQANSDSLAARYPNDDPPGCVGEAPTVETLAQWGKAQRYEPIAIIKLCQNYEYQACEHEGWLGSEAYQISQNIIAWAISKLPGYDTTPWGIR